MGDFDPRGVNERLVRKVRDALDENGFERCRIVVSGGFDVDRIRDFEAEERPRRLVRRRLVADPRRQRFHGRHRPDRRAPSAKVGRELPPEPAARARRLCEPFRFLRAVPMEGRVDGSLTSSTIFRRRADVASARLPRADRLPDLEVALADAAGAADRGRALLEVVRDLGRHRRRRRGRGRAAGGRRLPQGPAALLEARRPRAEGHPPLRPARHRQDAAGEGRRPCLRADLLLAERLGLRGDVRRPRRRPHPQALRAAPASTRPRSSSSTSSTPSACAARARASTASTTRP